MQVQEKKKKKRGKTLEKDLEMENELINDVKERAEHLMLVDLGRNDVGRVAKPGTVKVTDLMRIERYSHVMHIVLDGNNYRWQIWYVWFIYGYFYCWNNDRAPKIELWN